MYDSGNFPTKLSISGPCSNPRQYKEIQNVKIWLQCLTALTGRDEDEILHEIHQEFSNLNDVSSIRQSLKVLHLTMLYKFINQLFVILKMGLMIILTSRILTEGSRPILAFNVWDTNTKTSFETSKL